MSEAVQNILSSRLFSTRGGTIAVGGFAALLALLVLLLYLNNYRSSIRNSSAPVPVLVANHLIPQGTAGDVLGTSGGFEATEVPKGDVKEGALSDPAVLRGRVAVTDIYPGQQLTLADFTLTTAATLGSRLTGKQRAMSIPIDAVHGLIGTIVAGDRVDVLANLNGVIKPIMQNVLVLGVSGGGGGTGVTGSSAGSSSSSITFRLTSAGAGRLAFASDNGKIWVVLRPATRGGSIAPNATTLQKLLGQSTRVPEGN
jgi:pilus assembly protein CpaB